MKYLPHLGIWSGNTKQLLKAQGNGMRLIYQVGVTKYEVRYSPRSSRDPLPWVQVKGCGFRLRSTEIHAEK